MLFADWLKKYRNIAGLTQKELAQKLNIPQSTINKYENEGVEPRVSFAVSVAQILNASLDELSGVQVDKEQRRIVLIEARIKEHYENVKRLVNAFKLSSDYKQNLTRIDYAIEILVIIRQLLVEREELRK